MRWPNSDIAVGHGRSQPARHLRWVSRDLEDGLQLRPDALGLPVELGSGRLDAQEPEDVPGEGLGDEVDRDVLLTVQDDDLRVGQRRGDDLVVRP